ncbi:hypothetical protein GC194_11810 [bacterium]|nr:hypothetical protein [bacterium]
MHNQKQQRIFKRLEAAQILGGRQLHGLWFSKVETDGRFFTRKKLGAKIWYSALAVLLLATCFQLAVWLQLQAENHRSREALELAKLRLTDTHIPRLEPVKSGTTEKVHLQAAPGKKYNSTIVLREIY